MCVVVAVPAALHVGVGGGGDPPRRERQGGQDADGRALPAPAAHGRPLQHDDLRLHQGRLQSADHRDLQVLQVRAHAMYENIFMSTSPLLVRVHCVCGCNSFLNSIFANH